MSTALVAVAALMVGLGLWGNYTSIENRQILRSVVFDVIGFVGCYLAFVAGTVA